MRSIVLTYVNTKHNTETHAESGIRARHAKEYVISDENRDERPPSPQNEYKCSNRAVDQCDPADAAEMYKSWENKKQQLVILCEIAIKLHVSDVSHCKFIE